MTWQYVHTMDGTARFSCRMYADIVQPMEARGYKVTLSIYHINNGMRELTESQLYTI